MKRIFYIVTAVLFVSFIFILAKPRPVDVEAMRISPGIFEETIVSDGRVRAKTRQTVYAKATGTLEKIQIKLGDRLDANQVVGVLEWDIRKNVVSPITGVVTKVFRDSAGPINRGEPIFEVSAVDELEVVTELLTTDAIRLDKNSSAKITNWGGTGELTANVKKISRAGAMKVSPLGVEEERTEVVLELTQVSPEIAGKLGDNYHVEIKFLVSRLQNVMTVPLGAIFREGTNWAVFKIVKGSAQTQKIQVGLRNNESVVVTEGLAVGDEVVIFPGEKVKSGLKVKAVFRGN